MNEYLECVHVHNYHGLRGDLKVEHYCDDLSALRSVGRLFLHKNGVYTPFSIKKAVPLGHLCLIHLEGVESVEAALALKSKTLFAARSDFNLPDGHVFIADLVGLSVYNADDDGIFYGKVSGYTEGAASGIYEITTPSGTAVLLPAVDEFIVGITERGLTIRPIPGFFDEAEQ